MIVPVYNITEYLTDKVTFALVVNGFDLSSPNICVNLQQTGVPYGNFPRTDWRIQVISRSQVTDEALQNANIVYDLLHNKFHLTLPGVTVGSVVYAAIVAYQIICIQTPTFLTRDEENREMFVFNLKLTTYIKE